MEKKKKKEEEEEKDDDKKITQKIKRRGRIRFKREGGRGRIKLVKEGGIEWEWENKRKG